MALTIIPVSAQRIIVSNDIIDCGQVLFQKPVTAEFEIANRGSRQLKIADVRTDCGCTVVDMPPKSISKGEKVKIRATFNAQQMGHFQKQIGLFCKGNKPIILTMKGVVVSEILDFYGKYPFTIGSLLSDKNDIEFDDVNKGDQPIQKIHIMNPTGQTVQPVVMHLPGYLQAEVSPSKIAPKHKGVITLTLNSAMLHDFGLTQTSTYLGANPGEKISNDKELSVSAVLLPAFDTIDNAKQINIPKLKLSSQTLDLVFNGKDNAKGTIEITNIGKSLLEINSLQMFTQGLQISLSSTKIQPGQTAKLKVAANAEELKQARSKPRILMITNDPYMAKVIIDINTK